MNLQNSLKFFLQEHAKGDQPLLLGLSGGPDSMTLYHLLLQEGVKFAIAHVNHNWREESIREATTLEQMAFQDNISFHLLNLNPKNIKGNLELECRLERLKFFKTLCDQFNYQAVILGHHLDDQAETVLKRLFEGAYLTRLTGLKKVNVIDGLKILRPFLVHQKSELLNWLKREQISFFQDETNENPKFMRGRFRAKIIPYLNLEFGKNIEKPLNRLHETTLELEEYLKEKMGPYLANIVKTDTGFYLDFSKVSQLFEMKYLIRELTIRQDFYLSSLLIDKVAALLQANAANKFVYMMGKKVIIDRKKLFILSKKMQDLPETKTSLELDTNCCGSFRLGPWKVELTPDNNQPDFTGWNHVFHGFVQISIPEGKYCLTSKRENFSFLRKLWTDNKVPSFLRAWMPFLLKDEIFYKEFLTEKKSSLKPFKPNPFKLLITLNGIGVDDENRIC